MGIEISKFIRQNISIWDKIKVLLPEFFLHSDHIVAKSIFSCDFIALWKMIYLLVLIESFVEVGFATRGAGPKNIPFVRLSMSETIQF